MRSRESLPVGFSEEDVGVVEEEGEEEEDNDETVVEVLILLVVLVEGAAVVVVVVVVVLVLVLVSVFLYPWSFAAFFIVESNLAALALTIALVVFFLRSFTTLPHFVDFRTANVKIESGILDKFSKISNMISSGDSFHFESAERRPRRSFSARLMFYIQMFRWWGGVWGDILG
jgi:hypothetical protein